MKKNEKDKYYNIMQKRILFKMVFFKKLLTHGDCGSRVGRKTTVSMSGSSRWKLLPDPGILNYRMHTFPQNHDGFANTKRIR